MTIIRFLFALLLGFVIGAGTTLYLFHSGAGDFLIRRTESVQDLERRLHDVEQQRDQLSRQLDDVAARSTRMEGAFTDLERKFRDIQQQLDQARGGGARPGQ
jgi:septal ring factor EnvC (AmiA/AmiB activator)